VKNNFLYQNPILKNRRKELRNNATEAEKTLWIRLRKNQLGYKFTRQYSAGPYILDFYCPRYRLAIELDGGVHSNLDSKIYDKEREEYLKAHNIRTVRFWNSEVNSNIGKVLKIITKSLGENGSPLSS